MLLGRFVCFRDSENNIDQSLIARPVFRKTSALLTWIDTRTICDLWLVYSRELHGNYVWVSESIARSNRIGCSCNMVGTTWKGVERVANTIRISSTISLSIDSWKFNNLFWLIWCCANSWWRGYIDGVEIHMQMPLNETCAICAEFVENFVRSGRFILLHQRREDMTHAMFSSRPMHTWRQ